MALAGNGCLDPYATKCKWLWEKWPPPDNATGLNVIAGYLPAINYVPMPQLVSDPHGTHVCGEFDTQNNKWQILFNDEIFEYYPKLEGWLEFATVPYHEYRHAEQYSLVIMGLLYGGIKLKNTHKIAAREKMTDEDKELIKTGRYFISNSVKRRAFVSSSLNIMPAAVAHIDRYRNFYQNYQIGFKNKIQSWYDETWGKDKAKTDRILTTIHNNTTANRENSAEETAAYKGLPTEADAWGIQGILQTKIANKLGKNRLLNTDDTPPD
jgi:hypothetical protein